MSMALIKKMAFVFVMIIPAIIILEFSPHLLSTVLHNTPFNKNILLLELEQISASGQIDKSEDTEKETNTGYLGEHILHPYLGFVSVPRSDYNSFCFPGNEPSFKKNEDEINICIMGGSVAQGIHGYAGDYIISQLKKNNTLKNKRINLTALTLGGFKQPQQLLALNYFLSLGAQYDFVINLDGFNELVLPYSDNWPNGISPTYPRHWNIYSRKGLNSRTQYLVAKQLNKKEEQKKLALFFKRNNLYKSRVAIFTWSQLNRKKQEAVSDLEGAIKQSIIDNESDYQATGPVTAISDTLEFFKLQAEQWASSSKLINDLSKHNGFIYLHFLQPNQYVENSKSFTKEELQIAVSREDYSYSIAAKKGYKYLIENGAEIKQKGVNFFDLTPMFKNEKQSVYSDMCCHFNELGNTLIADKIVKRVLESVNIENKQRTK